MSNAVKFTPENGEITVEIKRLSDAPLDKTRLLFSVQDSGIGIHADKLEGILTLLTKQIPPSLVNLRNRSGTYNLFKIHRPHGWKAQC